MLWNYQLCNLVWGKDPSQSLHTRIKDGIYLSCPVAFIVEVSIRPLFGEVLVAILGWEKVLLLAAFSVQCAVYLRV